eukprot:94543-Rhodomonas_salina.2
MDVYSRCGSDENRDHSQLDIAGQPSAGVKKAVVLGEPMGLAISKELGGLLSRLGEDSSRATLSSASSRSRRKTRWLNSPSRSYLPHVHAVSTRRSSTSRHA